MRRHNLGWLYMLVSVELRLVKSLLKANSALSMFHYDQYSQSNQLIIRAINQVHVPLLRVWVVISFWRTSAGDRRVIDGTKNYSI